MASSTKDLKKVLTRKNLLSIAVSQIVGAGVMVMSIVALGMTGRSVNIAFIIAAIFTTVGAIPTIFYTSVVRLRGGTYSQAALFCGDKFAGFFIVTYFISNCSLAMYAMGFTSYLVSLVPGFAGYEKYISVALMTAFFTLNYFGTDKVAKVRDYMFYVLLVALSMFILFGVPRVHWVGYFGNELFGQPLFSNGINGLLTAASFLTFATGGAVAIVNYSAEAVNPQKDIPVVVIGATFGVTFIYVLLAFCIGGILPADEVVEAGNLAVIAQAIMPKPCYYAFIIGGVMFALSSTLNSCIGWVTKPLLQAVEDGWFPAWLGKLSKYKTPYVLQLIFYVLNTTAIMVGFDVSQIGQMALIIGNLTQIILIIGVMKLPQLFPEQWKKSPFHVSDGIFKLLLMLAIAFAMLQFYMNVRGTTLSVVAVNAVTFLVALTYSTVRLKSGKVHMTVSYDLD